MPYFRFRPITPHASQLAYNELAALPEGIFSDLSSLSELYVTHRRAVSARVSQGRGAKLKRKALSFAPATDAQGACCGACAAADKHITSSSQTTFYVRQARRKTSKSHTYVLTLSQENERHAADNAAQGHVCRAYTPKPPVSRLASTPPSSWALVPDANRLLTDV